MKYFAVAALLAGLWLQPSTAASPAHDQLFLHGEIKTPTGWVNAMAVSEGAVIALGDEAAVRAAADPTAEVIDLKGATVMPGLHDSHVHPLFAGLEQFQCRLAPASAPEVIQATVRACAAASTPGDWVMGGNWVAAAFQPGQQNRAFLDAAAPDNPVVLNDEAHHSVWVNSAALAAAGISRDTPNPEGGIIEREANGEPNGLLRETATRLVERVVPAASLELRRRALLLATHQMLAYGITSFTIASVRQPDVDPLSELSREGLIPQRMRGCFVWDPTPAALREAEEALIARRNEYATPRFQTDCVKLFLDGVPTESHTGAMLAPYADVHATGQDPRPPRGLLLVPQPELNAVVTALDSLGLSVKFHAAGDAAVRAAIDAVAAAHRRNGSGGPLHAVGHSTFVDAADIPRVQATSMAWEFSPYIWYPNPMVSVDVTAAVGDARMRRWMPVREAVETKALVVAGSDWSVVPSVNPWLGMETMVTRQRPGGSTETSGGEEAVNLDTAFNLFTVNAARLEGQGDHLGSLEVGKRADFVVTKENPWKMPITSLHAITVQMTVIDGERVYDAAR
jgi:hypothetical protein